MRKIKSQANRLFLSNYSKLMPLFLLISFVSLLITFLPGDILGIVVALCLVTMAHGSVILSLKLARHQEATITLEDALVGFKEYMRLFPSYIMSKLLVNSVVLIILIPAFIARTTHGGLLINDLLVWLRIMIGNDFTALLTLPDFLVPELAYIIVPCLLVALLIGGYLYLSYRFVGYYLADEDLSWIEALKASRQLVTSHFKELIQLYIMFIPNVILANLSATIFYMFSNSIVFYYIFSWYVSVTLYIPHIAIATALFYERVKDRHES